MSKFAYHDVSIWCEIGLFGQSRRTPRILVRQADMVQNRLQKRHEYKRGLNTLHVADASINGKHVSNNIHERCNGDLAEVIRNAIGFRTDTPCRLSWHVTYHNFLKPHLALHRKTPAKAS